MVILRNSRNSCVFHHGIANYTNMSLWLLHLFSFFGGSLIFAFDDAIASDILIFLLKFKSLFPFSWRADFVKSVLFCVGRMRFVLIDSTKAALFLEDFESYLVYSVFLEKRLLFPEYYYSNYLIISFCTVWY